MNEEDQHDHDDHNQEQHEQKRDQLKLTIDIFRKLLKNQNTQDKTSTQSFILELLKMCRLFSNDREMSIECLRLLNIATGLP